MPLPTDRDSLERLKDSLELLREQEGFRYLVEEVQQYQRLQLQALVREDSPVTCLRWQGRVQASQFVLEFTDKVISEINELLESYPNDTAR